MRKRLLRLMIYATTIALIVLPITPPPGLIVPIPRPPWIWPK